MGFLANILASLNPLLKKFISPIHESQVSLLPLLRGNLRLSRLQLQPKMLASLGVPFGIDVSFIGQVDVCVPIHNLLFRTIDVKVKNVLLVLNSIPSQYWSADE